MKSHNIKQQEQGFILFTILILLVILTVIGLSTYQRTTLSTKGLAVTRFKSVSKSISPSALNYIEQTWFQKPSTNAPGHYALTPCTSPCNPRTPEQIDKVITYLVKNEGNNPSTETEGFKRLKDFKDGIVFYHIENINDSSTDFLFRTTIISIFDGAVDVIESGYTTSD